MTANYALSWFCFENDRRWCTELTLAFKMTYYDAWVIFFWLAIDALSNFVL